MVIFLTLIGIAKKVRKGVKKERMKKQTCENFDPTEQSIKDCYIHTLTNIDIHWHKHAHHLPFKYYPWIIRPTTGLHQHRRRFTSFVYGYKHTNALYLSCFSNAAKTISKKLIRNEKAILECDRLFGDAYIDSEYLLLYKNTNFNNAYTLTISV